MYQAHYTADGTIKGFYIASLHLDIPTPTIAITDEQHADYFARGQNHKVIDVVWTYVEPPGPTLDEEAAKKLAELDQDAASAYVAGFYSEASGQRLYYDSDTETQKLLDGIIQRTTLADWETKVRYPGVAPAGQAPIRAKPTAASDDRLKTVQLLDAVQLKTLVDDLDGHLFTVKATLWQKQDKVKTAYDAGNIAGIKAVNWAEA